MRSAFALVGALAVGGSLAACGDGENQPRTATEKPPPAATTPTPPIAPELGQPAPVSAQANIFGAGRNQPPAPGGGGPGVAPPVWQLPEGTNRVITFPRVIGLVNPIVNMADENGPGGNDEGPTRVTSHNGISGIVHRRKAMFLVGVFLTDTEPASKAPPRLKFPNGERSNSVSPRIAQTFFVGDGKRRAYRVPPRATRLFLGFADAYFYRGRPGWYGNNAGELSVTVEIGRE